MKKSTEKSNEWLPKLNLLFGKPPTRDVEAVGSHSFFVSIDSIEDNTASLTLYQRRNSEVRNNQFSEFLLSRHSISKFEEDDKHLVEMALDFASPALYLRSSAISKLKLGYAQLKLFLPLLAQQEKILVDPRNPQSMRMQWCGGESTKTKYFVERMSRSEYALRCAVIKIDGERRRLSEAAGLCGSLVFFEDAIWQLSRDENLHFLHQLHEGGGVFQFPEEAASDVVEKLLQLNKDVDLPEELQWKNETKQPVFRIAISREGGSEKSGYPVKVECCYGEVILPLPTDGNTVADPFERVIYTRDNSLEDKKLDVLKSLMLQPTDVGLRRVQGFVWKVESKDLLAFAQGCVENSFEVYLDQKKVGYAGTPIFRVSTGVDWFDVKVESKKEAELDAWIAASRNGWLELKDGTVAVLPKNLIDQIQRFALAGKTVSGGFRFYTQQALVLDALLQNVEDSVECDEQCISVRTKLRNFSEIQSCEPSREFRGELREYQKLGIGWLNALDSLGLGGILADDMGLGKTIQVLSFLQLKKEFNLEKKLPLVPSLIVVPRTLVTNWMREAQRFTPNLKVMDLSVPSANRKENFETIIQADVVLTTYSLLRRDIETLSGQNFFYVVLDEAQNIKNSSSQTTKAARVLKAKRRLALTGTPIENSLSDLYSLLEFLNPGMLRRSGTLAALSSFDDRSGDASLLQLSRTIRPILLRRTKEQVLSSLPEKVENTLFCELDNVEMAEYRKILADYRITLREKIKELGLNRASIHILEAMLRLRQLACHPALAFKERGKFKSSSKLDLLVSQIAEVVASGHKALVFSSFTSFLDIIANKLKAENIEFAMITGETIHRAAEVDRFQNNATVGVFLLSLKAGGVGLNLTAADYCFILDPWWNPAAEQQAIDRAHRIGQTKTVFAFRIISRGTIEEKILELQDRKKSLSNAILRADESFVSSLSTDDVEFLLE